MRKAIWSVMCVIALTVVCGCVTPKAPVTSKSVKVKHSIAVDPKIRKQVSEDNKLLVVALKAKIVESKKVTTKEQRLAINKEIRVLQDKIAANNKKMIK